MAPIRSSSRNSRSAYLILTIVNAAIALWMTFSYNYTRMSSTRTLLFMGIFFFGVIAISYLSAYIISIIRPRSDTPSSEEILPWLQRILLFFRTLPGRMMISCGLIALLTMILTGFHAFGYYEVNLYENVGRLSGWRTFDYGIENRDEIFRRSPALLVTVRTIEPSPVQYLEGSLRIARELKPLGVRAFVVDTRPLTWTDKERQLLAELDSVGTVYWASETPVPEARGGLITRTSVSRGAYGTLPRITPLSTISPEGTQSPDILMKLTWNGRPNMQPLIAGDGFINADGIILRVMNDRTMILRDPYAGNYNMELWTEYDPGIKDITSWSLSSRYYVQTSELKRTAILQKQSAQWGLDRLYGMKNLNNKVAMLAWFPRQDYRYYNEWWEYATALRAIQMQSYIQFFPWLFMPMLLVSLSAVYLLSISFRPFLAIQLAFFVGLIVLGIGTFLYTKNLYIYNGTYALFAIVVASLVLPFQAAREEAKAMAEEVDGTIL